MSIRHVPTPQHGGSSTSWVTVDDIFPNFDVMNNAFDECVNNVIPDDEDLAYG